MRGLIVGAGTMGRWFGTLAQDWGTISVVDTDEEVARTAARELDAEVLGTPIEGTFDLVCIAVPMGATTEAIAEYGPLAEDAVIDLSGQMTEPLEAMRTHTNECERISIHPLFAPGNAPGNVPMVVEAGGPVAAEVQERLREAGHQPFETTAATHDRAMETVQAKVHAAVIAYALAADPVDERFHTPVSRGMNDLLEFVLHGTPHVYGEIQSRYEGAEDVAEAATRIARADEAVFESLYREASKRHAEDG